MAAVLRLLLALTLTIAASAAHAAPPALPVPVAGPRMVFIAGDGSLPVFDNAVIALDARLRPGGDAAATQRLTGSAAVVRHDHVRSATLDHVLRAISAMQPAAGQGCLVFATSHGVKDAGLYLALRDEVLSPRALDQALSRGCGRAPTVVVVSSCFSGIFAQPPMTRGNRIILTAARADRTSFGCQAGRVYTVFDQCLLAAVDRQAAWTRVYAATKACVSAEERRQDVAPSEPQAWFGADVADRVFPARVVGR